MKRGSDMTVNNHGKDLVSMIIPTYNRAGMIERVLNSVWSQTYRPIQLLVVNDGSPDNTVEVVTRWISGHSSDPGFSCKLIDQPNSGGCVARNNGLKQVEGEYVQFFDDDDELLPDAFRLHVDNLKKHPDIDASLGQAIYVRQDSSVQMRTHFCAGFFKHASLSRVVIESLPSPSFMLFRREFLSKNALCWDETMPCGQDTDLMVRVFLCRVRLDLLPNIVCRIYFHGHVHVSDRLNDKNSKLDQYLIPKWIKYAESHGFKSESIKNVLSYFIFAMFMRNRKNGYDEYRNRCALAVDNDCCQYTCMKLILFSYRFLPMAKLIHKINRKLMKISSKF